MNKPEPKVPFVMSVFNPNEGDNGFMLNTSPGLISFIIGAGIEDMFEINRISPSRALMVVNPCYDANEARAYLETLLTEAHAEWLVTGNIDAKTDTITKLQELLTSTEVTLGYYVHTLEEIKAYAKQSSSADNPVINHIVYTIETALKPRATAASDESGSGNE